MGIKKKIFITKSSEETQKAGEELLKNLNSNVIALYGELGSGKTTFVQGLAKGLGINRNILSPTFIIVRKYELNLKSLPADVTHQALQAGKILNRKSTSKIFKSFYHVDLYRIQSKHDIEGLGIGEILRDEANIVVIEWAEKIKDQLPKKRVDIYFEYLGEDKRRIKINR